MAPGADEATIQTKEGMVSIRDLTLSGYINKLTFMHPPPLMVMIYDGTLKELAVSIHFQGVKLNTED
ncbi:hypothetical protein FBU30_006603 [Linnemannia zychae]|nr:hypothetical protein FBU30_006603 [Linnemannia zychae]